ncbi:MAG: OmpH family outer membrane protein [Pseudomonadota bacterium]
MAIGLSGAALNADAQSTAPEPPRIVVIDNERVLRESDVARRLSALEGAARAGLQSELSALTMEIEREEAELTTLRDQLPKEEFDERVRAFNETVQGARRTFQQRNEAIQRRFARARQDAAEILPRVLGEMLSDAGADIAVDSRSVLAARPGADMSAEAIERFNAATADLFTGATLDGVDE